MPSKSGRLSTMGHLQQMFPPSPSFSPARDIPPLPGIRALITGGTSGIGLSTARSLLAAGAHVCLMARSSGKGERVLRELSAEGYSQRVTFIPLDLGDLASVRRAATAYIEANDRLHLLINNAAILLPGSGSMEVSAQGHDAQFATNALGHWHLTMLLLPLLRETVCLLPIVPSPASSVDSLPSLARTVGSHASSSSGRSSTAADGQPHAQPVPVQTQEEQELAAMTRIGVRVLTLSSNAHHFAPASTLNWWAIQPSVPRDVRDTVRKRAGGWGLYAGSKMANVIISNYLARTLGPSTGIVFAAIHPGGIKTDLSRSAPKWQNVLTNWMLYPAEYGALTTLWAATCENARHLNGGYCIPWARLGAARGDTQDWAVQDRLAGLLEEMRVGF
ncbi:NADP-binding protein [Dacryopinax primogenitus]|uniref:NADP-binding protein n=1 Tax=Dacryopinax primogenitus (strain DJM 731) TaxID=1858805 RepID=M5GF46_DACPD|nr:NADP-binding protein [Dacryopinax primogenitus]EJU05962.1 NADP-binding protein [Dacryopinax primogenitus]